MVSSMLVAHPAYKRGASSARQFVLGRSLPVREEDLKGLDLVGFPLDVARKVITIDHWGPRVVGQQAARNISNARGCRRARSAPTKYKPSKTRAVIRRLVWTVTSTAGAGISPGTETISGNRANAAHQAEQVSLARTNYCPQKRLSSIVRVGM